MSSHFNCTFQVFSTNLDIFILIRHIIKKNHIKIFCSKIWAEMINGQLSKLFVTLSFSKNFRNQIENRVSDYKLLGASSLLYTKSLALITDLATIIYQHFLSFISADRWFDGHWQINITLLSRRQVKKYRVMWPWNPKSVTRIIVTEKQRHHLEIVFKFSDSNKSF